MQFLKLKSLRFLGGPYLMAVWTGLEPATPCVTGRYSNQLNYQTNDFIQSIRDSRNSGIQILFNAFVKRLQIYIAYCIAQIKSFKMCP